MKDKNQSEIIEQDIIKQIYSDDKWHTWKCRCGCLNRRLIGSCGRCGGEPETYTMFYGNDGYVNPLGRQPTKNNL